MMIDNFKKFQAQTTNHPLGIEVIKAEIILDLPVALLASFNAASIASVPELVRYVEFKFLGSILLSNLQSFSDGFCTNSP